MIKRVLLAAPVSLALIAAAPLSAQDEAAEEVMIAEEGELPENADPMAGLGAMFGEMFKVDPLTAEQEMRLPTAERVAAKMMPDGTLAEVANGMFEQFMGPFMTMGPPPTRQIVNRGLAIYDLDVTDEEMAELASLIDPVWEEREKREKEAVPKVMASAMTVIEPSVRKGMAELFAIRFDEAELVGLDTFFGTELGTKFASESYKMAADPRVLSATLESLPALMGMMSDMKSTVEQATADLPPKREFSELSTTEKARVSELTGYSVKEIEEMIAGGYYAEEMSAEAADEASY